MGLGGVAIAILPSIICLKLTFSDGLGGGNFEASKLAYTRNVLNKGRLSLFVGIMMAVLFVFSIVGCTPYHDPDSPRSPEPENGTSASDSTKNEPGNGSLGVDTEYEDTIYYEF